MSLPKTKFRRLDGILLLDKPQGLSSNQALQRARAQRKEAAWAAFYQPSQACTLDPTTASCANEFISARKRFEAQYKDD